MRPLAAWHYARGRIGRAILVLNYELSTEEELDGSAFRFE